MVARRRPLREYTSWDDKPISATHDIARAEDKGPITIQSRPTKPCHLCYCTEYWQTPAGYWYCAGCRPEPGKKPAPTGTKMRRIWQKRADCQWCGVVLPTWRSETCDSCMIAGKGGS